MFGTYRPGARLPEAWLRCCHERHPLVVADVWEELGTEWSRHRMGMIPLEELKTSLELVVKRGVSCHGRASHRQGRQQDVLGMLCLLGCLALAQHGWQ